MTNSTPAAPKSSLIALVLLGLIAADSQAAPLIYYDGSGSGSTVTNLGTLGSSGNGAVTTDGSGSVTFQSAGGPDGAGDAYLDLVSLPSDGGWVTVPTSSLPNFANSTWSVTGFFNRTATSNDNDMVVHFGSGDGFGTENELYVNGASSSTTTSLQHYPNGDVNIGTSVTTGAWHAFAVTFEASGLDDGTGTLRYYIDGALVNSDSAFALSGLGQTLQWGGIGYGANSGSAARGFTGGLDDFAFYDTLLTAGEVAAVHSGTVSPMDVPEPGSAMLLGVACAVIGLRRRSAR